ncbi:MAG TPA: xanthine dehydrogenase small subunit [Casimicrobiaceae bacterium]|nr:xanthine dehydrogenase small subunit [Casimicrobiaceae bacterium]
MSEHVRFLLNGERVEIADLSPQTTLLEYLRDERRLTGTKEGCAEGDCGACTVVLAERAGEALAWKPINACIRLLPSVDGKAVFTVESLASERGEWHPVQQALVECHASQCGFCTPGFAMSLFGLYRTANAPSRDTIHDALSGNLCRCTGYRPIVDAAQRMYALPPASGWRGPGVAADGSPIVTAEDAQLAAELALLARNDGFEYAHAGRRWSAPRSVEALAHACKARPGAHIVAGMTDVALWVTKQHRELDDIIYVGDVAELAAIRETTAGIEIGAAVSLSDAIPALDRVWPELHEAWQRFASVPIRNSATLAGNVANGSPIGDAMPALMALDAIVVLRSAAGEREVALDAFYPAYRQTAREPGEFVAAMRIPRRPSDLMLRAYKISKRHDQDISAVFACVAMTLANDVVRRVRIGCGGVAATPVRARKTEALLTGQQWDRAAVERAAHVLAGEFAPIDDMRASAAYRCRVLGNLLRRFWLETTGASDAPTRIDALAPAPS